MRTPNRLTGHQQKQYPTRLSPTGGLPNRKKGYRDHKNIVDQVPRKLVAGAVGKAPLHFAIRPFADIHQGVLDLVPELGLEGVNGRDRFDALTGTLASSGRAK